MTKKMIGSTVGFVCLLLMISALNSFAADKRQTSDKRGAKTVELNSVPVIKPAPTTASDTAPATVLGPASAAASDAASEINWQVLSGGGGNAASSNFALQGTLGQIVSSPASSADLVLHQGYWQDFDFAAGGDCGNANGDGSINIGDVVFIINYIFREGPPSEPLCISDPNGDGAVNIGDAVFLVNYIFRGGDAPVPDCCPF